MRLFLHLVNVYGYFIVGVKYLLRRVSEIHLSAAQ